MGLAATQSLTATLQALPPAGLASVRARPLSLLARPTLSPPAAEADGEDAQRSSTASHTANETLLRSSDLSVRAASDAKPAVQCGVVGAARFGAAPLR